MVMRVGILKGKTACLAFPGYPELQGFIKELQAFAETPEGGGPGPLIFPVHPLDEAQKARLRGLAQTAFEDPEMQITTTIREGETPCEG
jgi:hypothetical protein